MSESPGTGYARVTRCQRYQESQKRWMLYEQRADLRVHGYRRRSLHLAPGDVILNLNEKYLAKAWVDKHNCISTISPCLICPFPQGLF